VANLSQIEKFLKSKNLKYKVIDLGGEVYKVKEVIKAGVQEDEIVKTLIVRTDRQNQKLTKNKRSTKNWQFLALAVRGKDRVDFKKVRRLFGSKCELASSAEVEKVVGVPVGAVCPVLIEVLVYFDRQVMNLKRVNMGSGDLTKGLEMKLTDLLAAVGEYQVADLVIDDS